MLNILNSILFLSIISSLLLGKESDKVQSCIPISSALNLSTCEVDTITGSFLLEHSDNLSNEDDMILHTPLILEESSDRSIMENYRNGVYFLQGSSAPNNVLKQLLSCNLKDIPVTLVNQSENSMHTKFENLPSEEIVIYFDKKKISV